MKKVLVTGGAGFIGSHLCEYLLNKGYKVICMDNFLTGSKENIKHLEKNSHFLLIDHDVTKEINFKGDLDFIYHLASPASPVDYQQIPIKTLKINALGTYHVLGLALAKKARFLLASTSEIYGDPQVNPQPEEYWGNVNTIGVRSCYDEGKRFAESLTMAYRRFHKLDTRIVRVFNTYGPRMRAKDGRVIPTFINQALKGEALTVFGTGKQTRSFCYVSDMVVGLHSLMLSKELLPVNLGNPVESTIQEIAGQIIKIIGSKSKIITKPLPEDDPHVRCPDIKKAKNVLKWEPKVNLDTGLKKTIEYFST
ncbi:MAG: SDR family oxidoreductase [Candidatus Woesearchaeota archaeon]|jgi:dTDP-glucose 4,6-dehydratase|nr:SDR family oxidoreductase [Candidatus Woesearchaeota archaeon]MDP7457554.1 SDR family oxidoreductase [Candidatus Woesearchaeota archaeon]